LHLKNSAEMLFSPIITAFYQTIKPSNHQTIKPSNHLMSLLQLTKNKKIKEE